jgi:hypothetical protein
VAPTELSVLDYAHTAGGPALFMTVVLLVVLPLAWRRLARRRRASWPARVGVLGAIWSVAFLVAYGDVYWIAWHTRRHCEREAGLEVLRTVTVDEARDRGAVEAWFRARARFVEEHVSGGRLHTNVRGPRAYPAFVPAYEYRVRSGPAPGRLWRTRYAIRELASGEELAVLTVFEPGWGWLDRPLSAMVARNRGCRGPGLGELPLAFEALLDAAFRPGAGIDRAPAAGAAP